MKANELRIGNWLQRLDGSFFQCTPNDILIIYQWDGSESLLPKPIPITEELLLKCGFEKKHTDVFIKGIYDLEPLFSDSDEWDFCIYEKETNTKLKYLHQLQNLYFALTGKELEINL